MPTIRYSSNNSGGSWWLTDENWKALEAAGWSVEWVRNSTSPWRSSGERWLGALATAASKSFDSVEAAKVDFERVTGLDPEAHGCSCCGPPHCFSERD